MDVCLTGEETIDTHHKHLVGMIEEAIAAITNQKITADAANEIIGKIESYALGHFAYEEEVIDRVCPASVGRKNKEGHAYFRLRVAALRLSQGKEPALSTYVSALTLLRGWFEGHVCDVDCRLRGYIRRHD